MRCPYCGGLDTQVKDSRPTEDNASIRRRRACPDCGGRFTTFERVQLRELTVVKKNGRRAPFDRDKLQRSVEVALRKRDIAPERIERMINGVVRQLEAQGDADIADRAHRRTRHGGAEDPRRDRLRAFRLGLPEFPRGAGFQHDRRRARRGARAEKAVK